MPAYQPKISFWTKQQEEAFNLSYDKPLFALFMDPRTGKSKPIVDTCSYQWQNQSSPLHVRGLLVIVWPNGAHVGWVKDAFPESFGPPWAGHVWDAGRASSAPVQRAFAHFLKDDSVFRVLAINAESLISETCRRAIGQFLTACSRVMVTADESSFMANREARRARIMANIAQGEARRFIVMKRILDGTPVDRKGPLDMFTQVGFLDPNILGYDNFVEYQAHYAVIETHGRGPFWSKVKELENQLRSDDTIRYPRETAIERAKRATLSEKGRTFRAVPGRDYWTRVAQDDAGPIFKNMNEFWQRLGPHSYRATYEACFPDAARPVFAKRRFDLSIEQRRVYDDIVEEYRATLADGREVTAAHHLTRILRLQQVASNYLPGATTAILHDPCEGEGCEGCGWSGIVETRSAPSIIDAKVNPRAEALAEELREGLPTIVWTRFQPDADVAMGVAATLGMDPVRLDGTMSNPQKLESRRRFQEERSSGCIVANWAAGSRGIPLHAARKHVAFNNQLSFRTRRQGEERAEHGTKTVATSFVDLIANDTVDDNLIVPTLRQGMSVSTVIMRDARRVWI